MTLIERKKNFEDPNWNFIKLEVLKCIKPWNSLTKPVFSLFRINSTENTIYRNIVRINSTENTIYRNIVDEQTQIKSDRN